MSDTDIRSDPDGASAPTRERILSAALEIAGKEGFRALTTRRVAERAGVRLGLIHYHFGSKAALAAETEEAFLREIVSRIRAVEADGRMDEEEAMVLALAGILDAALSRPGILEGIFRDEARYRPLADRLLAFMARRLGPDRQCLARERGLRLLASVISPFLLTKIPGEVFGLDLRLPEARASYVRGAVAEALAGALEAGSP